MASEIERNHLILRFKMRLTDTDLRLLRVFSTIVQCGGFSKAQTILNVSQPTISNQISALERRLGFRLCDRGRSGFRLTLKGEETYRAAQQLFASIETFQNETTSLQQVLLGELRLGIADGLLCDENPYVEPIITSFSRQAPDVRLSVMNADPPQLEQRLNESRLDVVIGDFNEPELYFGRNLYTEEHRLYAVPHHPLCANETPHLEDVLGARVIRRGYSDPKEARCLSGTNAAAVVNTAEAAITLILTGNFVGFLPEHLAERWVASGRMQAVNLPEMRFERKITIYRRHNRKMSRLVRAFLACVDETMLMLSKDAAVARG
ncbi:LysR family transcriptional regulator [Microvirga alba]|uniref:LysR family transcriptional regulator n=1 Tax=Microvirga alba TaxID=2791025 RepID=A0A931BV85_9HYPH|nr:LysR family transcriptional regulator [Microvirga alba]MBF9235338.1 LysR family transcriptional regulator [Microvirga alba]